MAEAIAAFGVAANVIQFIDVGSRVATNMWSFYQGTGNAAKDIPDVDSINRDLQQVLKDLQNGSTSLGAADHGLVQLVRDCQDTANELETKVHPLLKARSQARGKREAFKAALKLIWEEDEIDSLRNRLNGFRHQLTLHLLSSLRYDIDLDAAQMQLHLYRSVADHTRDLASESASQQTRILAKITSLSSGSAQRESFSSSESQFEWSTGLDRPALQILEFITSKLELSIRRETKSWLKQELIDAIHYDKSLPSAKLSTFQISKPRLEILQGRVIGSLRYSKMEDREDRITETYGTTFQWIFEDCSDDQSKWSSFKNFLTSDVRLYWVTGKAGSGKSTLMKYVCQRDLDSETRAQPLPPRCFEFLREWAGDCHLVTATFFFWNSGLALQMKQEGLFRTLLVQILRQIPELIPAIAPNRWEALCLLGDDPLDWSDQELQQMLCKIIPNLERNTKLCLFIDGLDEFEGSHSGLIAIFKQLIQDPRVKLCVSSRPWVEFEDAFKHAPSLMLQDLTYSDIKYYVTSNMENDPRFDLLRRREPVYARELVENIVVKSSGVFLWTRLAVVSILSGMGHGDRVFDLQSRLDTLPAELEQLYDKIINNLDPFYLEHAAQLFRFIRESTTPPSVLALSFADDEFSLQRVIDHPMGPTAAETAELLHDTMRRRINSRCKGLLEIQSLKTTSTSHASKSNWELRTVQYLHRTVKDFVERPDVQNKLESSMKNPFDPHFGHCVGWLVMVRARPLGTPLVEDTLMWDYIDQFLYHASKVEPSHYAPLLQLMDELDKTCSLIAKQDVEKLQEPYWLSLVPTEQRLVAGQWASFHPYRARCRFSGGQFLSLAVRYGVLPFIQRNVNSKCLIISVPVSTSVFSDSLGSPMGTVYPLLLDAIAGFLDPGASSLEPKGPNIEVIACLLGNNADPNHKISKLFHRNKSVSRTIWQSALDDFVRVLFQPKRSLQYQALWASVCKIMLENRAGDFSSTERRRAVAALDIFIGHVNSKDSFLTIREDVTKALKVKMSYVETIVPRTGLYDVV